MTLRRTIAPHAVPQRALESIGVNAVFLQRRMGGVETYLRQLVPAMLEARRGLRITLFVSELGLEALHGEPWLSDVKVATHPLLGRPYMRAVTEMTLLGHLASTADIDVLHSVALTAPLKTRPANVLTVADVIWLREPESVGRAISLFWRSFVPVVARRADRIITHSQAAREEISEDFRLPAGRIDVVPHGPGVETPVDPTPEIDLRRRLQLGAGPIVLSVSAFRTHKNLVPLVRAMPAVRRVVADAVLVLPGNPTKHQIELEKLANALAIHQSIRFPGWVDAADLEALYRAAACFVFPSRHEGFGLPILEAMRRGVPVACARASALPEVAGDAALYFDPERPDQIAAVLLRLLTDPSAAAELATRGVRHQRSFTWQRTAEATLRSYARALQDRDTRGGSRTHAAR
jgi:glycosyltransferase involved in cell wall biosynthesis